MSSKTVVRFILLASISIYFCACHLEFAACIQKNGAHTEEAGSNQTEIEETECKKFTYLPMFDEEPPVIASPDYRSAAQFSGYLQIRRTDSIDYNFVPLRLDSLKVVQLKDRERQWYLDVHCGTLIMSYNSAYALQWAKFYYSLQTENGTYTSECNFAKNTPFDFSIFKARSMHYACNLTRTYYCEGDENFLVGLVMTRFEIEAERPLLWRKRPMRFQTVADNCTTTISPTPEAENSATTTRTAAGSYYGYQ